VRSLGHFIFSTALNLMALVWTLRFPFRWDTFRPDDLAVLPVFLRQLGCGGEVLWIIVIVFSEPLNMVLVGLQRKARELGIGFVPFDLHLSILKDDLTPDGADGACDVRKVLVDVEYIAVAYRALDPASFS
jgi:hypothetical protein